MYFCDIDKKKIQEKGLILCKNSFTIAQFLTEFLWIVNIFYTKKSEKFVFVIKIAITQWALKILSENWNKIPSIDLQLTLTVSIFFNFFFKLLWGTKVLEETLNIWKNVKKISKIPDYILAVNMANYCRSLLISLLYYYLYQLLKSFIFLWNDGFWLILHRRIVPTN